MRTSKNFPRNKKEYLNCYVYVFLHLCKKLFSPEIMKIRFCMILLLLSSVLHAQNDSVGVVTEDTTVKKENIIDRVMHMFEYNRGRTSVKCYPSMGIDPASGVSLGVLSLLSIEPAEKDRKKIKFYRPTSISNSISYSTKNWVNFRSDMMVYANHGIMLNTLLQFQHSPDKYYGIGNDTLNTDPVKFNMSDLRFSGNVSKELSSTCYLGFMFDVSFRECSSQGANEEGLDLPELKNRWAIGFGPHFTFDRRDHVNYPSRGEFCTLGFKYFAPHTQNAYSFYSVELDIRKYFTLYKDFILACQMFGGMSNGEMPFYCLYQLGGQTRLRGLSNKYMYIDKCAYFAQAELRKHIWSRFSLVAFGGAGNTFPQMSDIRVDHMKYIYGVGVRFQSDTKNNINLRLDYGRGSFGDSGVYMTMREAF